MTVRDKIIHRINENVYVSAPVTEKANLYSDLGFDSFSFITLLMEIEDAYSITFDVMEMETCLQVERLITIVESKIEERGIGND